MRSIGVASGCPFSPTTDLVRSLPVATNRSLRMLTPFLQALSGERICCYTFHYGQSKIEQFAGAKYVSHGLPYSGTVVPGPGANLRYGGGCQKVRHGTKEARMGSPVNRFNVTPNAC